ncbi:hypothetical protein AAU61_09800 [Desulfocarbo indianensis]|nr:hypothetical protein AAU61_09800 [Desulfocarbo indianensis]
MIKQRRQTDKARKPFRRKSLAAQLTWVCIIMVTLTVLSLGAGLILIAAQAQREISFQLQRQSAEQVSQLISGYMSRAVSRLTFFAENKQSSLQSPQRRKSALENLLITSMPLYSQVSFLDQKGDELSKVSRFHSYLPGEHGNKARTPAFITAIMGELYTGEISLLGDTGLLSMTIALPVRTAKAEIFGVIVAEININHLWQDVARIKVGSGGYVYLVDKKGRFVAYQKPAEVLQRHGEDVGKLPPVAEFIKNNGSRQGSVQKYRGLFNEEVIGVQAPIPGTVWAVVVEQPTREAFVGISKMQRYLVSLLLAGAILAGALGYLIARRLVGPIRELTAAAERFGTGDLESEFREVPRQDEVGILSSAFKEMQGELHDLYAGLRHKVEELEMVQDALRKSEENYRSIFENASEGIFQATPAGRYLSVNPALCRMLGYASPLEMIETVKDIPSHIYARQEDREIIQAMLEKEGALNGMEVEQWRKDGSKIIVSLNIHAVRDAEGQTLYYEGTVEDVSAKKRAEEEREKLWTMLQTAFAQSPVGIVIADAPDGRIRMANSQALMIRGAAEDYLTGIEFGQHSRKWQIFHTDGAPYPTDELPLVKAIRKGEAVFNEEMIIRDEKGEDHLIFVNAAPIRDQEGVITSGVAVFQDITEHKRLEEERKAHEKRLQAIWEASADPMVVYDQQGRATYVNPAFSRVFGWSAEEVLGRRVPFVPEDQAQPTMEAINALYNKSASPSFETKRLTKDGQTLNVLISAAGVTDEMGEVVGMVVNLTDMTKTKRLESQLRQAQKMEAIGTLAGGIAHDFNNILGSVIGYTELAQRLARKGSENSRELDQVMKAAERARNLVKQILTFSRKAEAEPRPLSMNALVMQTLQLLEPTLPKMISLETQLSPALNLINADPNQMEQVIINLATNAADAMPDGGRLLIETGNVFLDEDYCAQHLEVRPGQYVLLMFSDTGQGMTHEIVEHIFDPFFTTKKVGKGTGLGLSTVYGIVKGHGGYVYCYSECGLGTTFKIYLPVRPIEAPLLDSQRSLSEDLLKGGETILLVDDEEPLRELGAMTMQSMGYKVLTACNGEEALRIYAGQGGAIDLVVMDLGMPGMGGHKAMKKILALNPEAKVVIASGYSANGQVKDSLESGAAGYVAKPFRLADLLGSIRSVLDR